MRTQKQFRVKSFKATVHKENLCQICTFIANKSCDYEIDENHPVGQRKIGFHKMKSDLSLSCDYEIDEWERV